MEDHAEVYVEIRLPWMTRGNKDRVCCAMALTHEQIDELRCGPPPRDGPMSQDWYWWQQRRERSDNLRRHIAENIAHQVRAFFDKEND